ncbi:MAG: YfiR family protein [Cytophagales bacterium]|nr:YfiR family protein [Cytophagales bacterium]
MVQTKTRGQQNFKIANYKDVNEVGKCHILYIDPGLSDQLYKVIQITSGQNTLIVGEGDDLAAQGAGISFYVARNKQSMEVNRNNLEKYNLKISSQLEMENTSKYLPDALKTIKYLSSTFYNDAVDHVEKKNFDPAKKYFEHFKNALILSRDKSIDLKEREIAFQLALGSNCMELYKKDSTRARVNPEGAKAAYEKILKIDSNHMKANYNPGVLYDNEAVNLIDGMDYDEVDLMAISQIEDQSIGLFKQSLPFMEVAYKQNPKDRNTLEGLAGIYFSLREYEKSNAYKEKLVMLENEE